MNKVTSEPKIPRGIRNNNPLNIRKGNDWIGERKIQTDPAFEQFETMQYGIRAAFIILRQYMTGYWGITQKDDTIEKIIKRWAPDKENPTKKYIQYVSNFMGISPNEPISFKSERTMVKLVDAMIAFECGQRVDISIIQSAYKLI